MISRAVYHVYTKVLFLVLGAGFFVSSTNILGYVLWRKGLGENQVEILTVKDIGQGDSLSLNLSGGQKILIDTGNDFSKFEKSESGEQGPGLGGMLGILKNMFKTISYKRKTYDLVFLTHDDADHAGVISKIFDSYKVGTIISSTLKYSYLDRLQSDKKVGKTKILKLGFNGVGITFHSNLPKNNNVQSATRSQKDASINIIYPDFKNEISKLKTNPNNRAANEDSIVFVFNPQNSSNKILFTGDSGTEEEKIFAQRVGQIDILKVGHHGSKTSTSEYLLSTIKPKIALISSGKNNSYGHPHKQVLDLLKKYIPEKQIYRTDNLGALQFYMYEAYQQKQ